MKKQCKKFSLWGFKGLLSVALSSLVVVAYAQGAEVCTGTPYTIASTVDASGASTYQWLENGLVLPGATAAGYTVPSNKAAGVYTYIRQAKSADCSEWQSSNEFTVTVFACSFTAGTATGSTATFTDPRDGKKYKTVVMPDGRTWFAQNLNYTKDLMFNMHANQANGKLYISPANGVPAIGSYWCPSMDGSTYSGDPNTCNIYGALYTWETAMMVDGKYADETKTGSAWDESWVSGNYYASSDAISTTPNADKNNARGGTNVKGGGRGICPMGWHVPTHREWAIMLDAVEDSTIFLTQSTTITRGTKGRSLCSTTMATNPNSPSTQFQAWNQGGTDSLHFSLIGSGSRHAINKTMAGYLSYVDVHNSATTSNLGSVVYRLSGSNTGIDVWDVHRAHGKTVRCLKN